MDVLQEILVFIVFAVAIIYMITKFIGKPKFMQASTKTKNSCGSSGCGCG